MTKDQQHLLVFFGSSIGTIVLYALFGLYTLIIFPILLFTFAFAFRSKTN